jgi:hypothetical protein
MNETNNRLTVIIPSRNEIFLNNTINDVLANATGDIEVVPILDGYEPDVLIEDPRVNYLRLPKVTYTQKRHGINAAVDRTDSKYVMALDAHCMVAPGFDEQLKKDHQPNWIQVPRRHRLDAENWCLQEQSDDRPPIDYEYIMFRPLFKTQSIHGFKWDERTLSRWDIPIDDILTFQGSCWFMTKDWFKQNGFMQIEGYTGWGQEAEELSFTTWKNGGECKVNKNTWYAHLHKGQKYGRMYWMSREENRKSYSYSYKTWMIDNRDFFMGLIEKFSPLPAWPSNWKEQLQALPKE